MRTMKTLSFALLAWVSLALSANNAFAINCSNVDPSCSYQCDQVNHHFQRVQDSCNYSWDFYWINYGFCRAASNAYNRAADAFLQCLSDL